MDLDLTEAALYDFVLLLQADEDAHAVRPIEEYIALFPGHESALREEYAWRLGQEQEGAAAPAEGEENKIGPYRLLQELGRGGQGTVYLAEDTNLDRKVALKVLSTPLGLISDDRLARFAREAKVVARLEHPGICPIYEAELDAELSYIAMRYVEGGTLAAHIGAARGRFLGGAAKELGGKLRCFPERPETIASLLAYFEGAALALHAANEAGVVHRDIKPGNMMVTHEGQAVLLDFGIARAQGEGLETLTRSGEVFGTLLYMPPEQLRGTRASRSDARVDVYGLGASMFEAFGLKPPFEAEDQFALTEAILHAPVPDICALNPALPKALQAVLETALDKNPARRYSSALEFALDIARLREDETVLGRRAGFWLRARRLAWRRPRVASLLATAVIGGVLGSALWSESSEKEKVTSALESNRQLRALEELKPVVRKFWRQQRDTQKDASSALIYAYYWFQVEQTPDSRAAILETLVHLWESRRLSVVKSKISAIQQLAGGLILCGDEGGRLRLFDLSSGERLDKQDDNGQRKGHSGIAEIAVDEAGTAALSVTRDGSLRYWPVAQMSASEGIDCGGARISSVSFRPGSLEFLALQRDGRLARGDLAEGRGVQLLDAITSEVTHACYDASGSRLLTIERMAVEAGAKRSARLFLREAGSGQPIATFAGELGNPTSLAFNPQQSLVALADDSGRVLIRSLEEPQLALHDFEQGAAVTHLEFDPGASMLAVTHLIDASGQIAKVWKLDEESESFALSSRRGGQALEARFNPAGTRIALLLSDRSLSLFDTATGTREREYPGLRNGSVTTRWTRDGETLLAASFSYLHFLYPGTRPFLPQVKAHQTAIEGFHFLASGKRLLSRAGDGSLALWSWPTLSVLGRFEVRSGLTPVGGGALHDGDVLWMAYADGRLYTSRRKVERDEGVAPLAADDWRQESRTVCAAIHSAQVHPDGERILVLPAAGPARLLDAQLQELQKLGRTDATYNAACFDISGHKLALAGPSSIEIWSLAGDRLATLPRPASLHDELAVLELAFSGKASARLLVRTASAVTSWLWREGQAGSAISVQDATRVRFDSSGGGGWMAVEWPASKTVELWPTDGTRSNLTQAGHQSPVTCVQLPSATEARILSGAADGSVRILDAVGGELQLEFSYHAGAVTALAIDPSGQRLVSGSADGELHGWPLDLGHAAREAYTGNADLDLLWKQTKARFLEDILAEME